MEDEMKKKKIRKQLKRIARKQKRVLDDIYGLIGKLDGGAPIIPVGLMKALLGTTNEKEEADDGPQIYGVKWDYSDPKNIPVRIGKCAGWPKPSPAGDIDEEDLADLRRLEARHSIRQEITDAIRWARLYGGYF